MWRYLVLCTFGGVYADSDVVCAKPVDEWHQAGAGLLVGIENVFTTMEAAKKRTYTRMMQVRGVVQVTGRLSMRVGERRGGGRSSVSMCWAAA